MSISLKKMIRDRLVNDSAMRTFLGVTTTASAPVNPTFIERTAIDSQIVYSLTDGPSDAGMNSQNGFLTFNIQVQATGGANPHIKYGDIENRISGLFDDQSISGAAISGTGVNSLLFLREGGIEASYDPERKMFSKILNYSYRVIGG